MIKYYEEQDERNDRLIEILKELSDPGKQDILRDQQTLISYIERFNDIYFNGIEKGKKFRHSYARIYQFLYDEMYMEGKDSSILEQNVDLLYKYCSENDEKQMAEMLYKLMDHMELDMVRISRLDSQVGELNEDVELICDDIKDLSAKNKLLKRSYTQYDEQANRLNTQINKIKKSQKKFSKINDQVENAYSQFISILGIFSAIVLVFFGGTSVFASFFQNMADIPYYKTSFTLAIIGIILFDIIFMFFYILSKLLKRNIASIKQNVDGCIAKRIYKRYPYVALFHLIMGIILVISIGFIYHDYTVDKAKSMKIENAKNVDQISSTAKDKK